EIGAIRRQPAIARAAAHDSIERSEGAISRNLRGRGILRYRELFAVDVEAGEVAVTEVRRIHESVIRGDGEPAQLRRQAPARVDLHERADVDLAVSIDGCHGAAVADSVSDDEGIRPAVQEGDVERRGPLRVVKPGFAKRAVLLQGEYDDAVGVWCIRSDDVQFAIWPMRDPDNHCTVRIVFTGQLVERGAYNEEFPVGREHGHR